MAYGNLMVLPSDNRAANVASAIGNLTDTLQQRRQDQSAQADQQKQDAQQQMEDSLQPLYDAQPGYAGRKAVYDKFHPNAMAPDMPKSFAERRDEELFRIMNTPREQLKPSERIVQDAHNLAGGQKPGTAQENSMNASAWGTDADGKASAAVSSGLTPSANTELTVGEHRRHNFAEEGQTAPLRVAQTGAANAEIPLRNAQTKAALARTDGGGGNAPISDQMAQAIADRQFDPALLRTLVGKNPEMVDGLVQRVHAIDPNFSMADYPANVATKKAYASGQQAQNITAINTAIRHLNALHDDSAKMNNGRFPMMNTVGNYLAAQTGDEGVQQHAAAVSKDADAVANELNKAFRGSSQLSEKDTAGWRQGLGPNATPAEIKGAVGAALTLLAGRNIELAEGYKRGVGRPVDRAFLDQGARQIIQRFGRFGIDGTAGLLGDTGATSEPSAQPKTQANYAQTATGPNGHKIGSNDGHTWFDVQTGQPVK